jgi:ElaB/YqjD/DUF883 family membrane-anchored ribosome-binding protein
MQYPDSETKTSAQNTAENVTQGIHDKMNETVDMVTEKASKVAEDLTKKGEKFVKSQEKLIGECSDWVRDNPMTAIAVAAGVGYVFSKITR